MLRRVAAGKSNKLIAAELGISEGTVKTHMKSILPKLDASDRTHAVMIALKRGILTCDGSVHDRYIIGKTVEPPLARLGGCDHRMTAGADVCTRMARRRIVTAERDAARLAGSQMHPSAARFHPLVAHVALRLLDIVNRRKVRTRLLAIVVDLACAALLRQTRPTARWSGRCSRDW